MKIKNYKFSYKELGNGLISCLDYAMKLCSRFVMINLLCIMLWYSFIGYTYLNGTLSDEFVVFDSTQLRIMWSLYIVIYLLIYFIRRMLKKDFEGVEVVGTTKLVDNSMYVNLIGKCFRYDCCIHCIKSYKRILTFLNKNERLDEDVFDVEKIQADGIVHNTIWTLDELYMALAEDEGFK